MYLLLLYLLLSPIGDSVHVANRFESSELLLAGMTKMTNPNPTPYHPPTPRSRSTPPTPNPLLLLGFPFAFSCECRLFLLGSANHHPAFCRQVEFAICPHHVHPTHA